MIPVVQAPAIVPFNTHYWVGWPTADNPWIMPVPWWAQFNLVVSGYYSPAKGQWVGGIKPARVDYTTVYFTKDTPKFRGIDLVWYGPFKAGDAARIPSDDADFWIKKGYASLTPQLPTVSIAPEIKPLVEQVIALNRTLSSLRDSINDFAAELSGLSNIVLLNTVLLVVLLFTVMYLIIKTRKQ
ncbi:hypothetical protein [Infirmifilum sp.]|uniref:DNA replication complex subunit Gins51 n=1 Tax=Infirmifilum sp. TaxID=2856575 RepID=UPI003D1001CA